jgi:hypothetical protein
MSLSLTLSFAFFSRFEQWFLHTQVDAHVDISSDCVCLVEVCKTKRERERETERKSERYKKRERERERES